MCVVNLSPCSQVAPVCFCSCLFVLGPRNKGHESHSIFPDLKETRGKISNLNDNRSQVTYQPKRYRNPDIPHQVTRVGWDGVLSGYKSRLKSKSWFQGEELQLWSTRVNNKGGEIRERVRKKQKEICLLFLHWGFQWPCEETARLYVQDNFSSFFWFRLATSVFTVFPLSFFDLSSKSNK